MFDYKEFTGRNIGFVSEKEQEILRNTTVFIPGVGGMGGAALATLVRMGIENFIIADMDEFDVSNLNRQIFATLDTVGKSKVESTKQAILNINPNVKLEVYDNSWSNHLDEILPKSDIVINGNDDIRAAIQLMRKAKEHNKTVVDAFASPLPNIFVVKPSDQRPENVFKFPTVGIELENISEDMLKECSGKEIEHVLVHSNSSDHVHLDIASEMIAGTRKRISFAPMVWTTGCLMAYEIVRFKLNKKGGPGIKGVFVNPWTMQVEKPRNFISAGFRRIFVRKFLNSVGNVSQFN